MRQLICLVVVAVAIGVCSLAYGEEKTCGVYTSILDFTSRDALKAAVDAQPPFLSERRRQRMAKLQNDASQQRAKEAGFNTLFMTIYPLNGCDWWTIPAARSLIHDAIVNGRKDFRIHIGLDLYCAEFCEKPSRYPGASRTIQCDGTRPDWVCFVDDRLWDLYIRNAVELAKLGNSIEGNIDGFFIDPEAYGPECYFCFCDNCVKKFNAYSGANMPTGLVKPDAWLHEHGLWEKYAKDWHPHEVRRHAEALRDAIHAVNPKLQLSSLLWDYPVAVDIHEAREDFFRNLAIGLGTKEQPSWTMPEHSYYSDAADLKRIIDQVNADIAREAPGLVRVLPGIRILRRSADSLLDRGKVIRDADVPGYWLYELADLGPEKTIVDFEGAPTDPLPRYIQALRETNEMIIGGTKR